MMRASVKWWVDFALGLAFVLALALVAVNARAGVLEFMSSPHGFATCSALDIGSTIAANERDPSVYEVNPLYGAAFEEGKYAGPIAANLALIGLAYYFREEIHPGIFLGVNIVRCGAAGLNMRFVF